MPMGNEDAYKKMYEMGQELMEMAKAGGYDPDQTEDYETEAEDTMPEAAAPSTGTPSSDKVSTALRFLNTGR